MLRRGLALGGGLIVLILIVLGVKGCLDARAPRELSDYARNVTQIVEGTEQTSKDFFSKLEDPGTLSVTEFTNEVNADSSAMSGYASRVDGLSAPGDMGSAQNSLELVYELRASAMEKIAAKMSTALGDAGSTKATAAIAKQMQTLLASDVVYEEVVRPEINGVLASQRDLRLRRARRAPSSPIPSGWKKAPSPTRSARSAARPPAKPPASTASASAASASTGSNWSKAPPRWSAAKKPRKSKSRSKTRANRPRTASPSRSPSTAATPWKRRSNRSPRAKPRR